MEKQTQMDAGTAPSQQQGQTQPQQRRKTETVQAGATLDTGKQMQGTQFTDWASI